MKELYLGPRGMFDRTENIFLEGICGPSYLAYVLPRGVIYISWN